MSELSQNHQSSLFNSFEDASPEILQVETVEALNDDQALDEEEGLVQKPEVFGVSTEGDPGLAIDALLFPPALSALGYYGIFISIQIKARMAMNSLYLNFRLKVARKLQIELHRVDLLKSSQYSQGWKRREISVSIR